LPTRFFRVHDLYVDIDYIKSERFIHDDLIKSCQAVVDRVRTLWKEGQQMTAYAIAWPARTIKTDDGTPLEGAVVLTMPSKKSWKPVLSQFVERTAAYGLFLLEVEEDKIVARFETMHGARGWTIPIERHGDRLVLGDQRVSDNKEHIGLLWTPVRGAS
jgi:hypothetical protein